jgi:hypothetical protein
MARQPRISPSQELLLEWPDPEHPGFLAELFPPLLRGLALGLHFDPQQVLTLSGLSSNPQSKVVSYFAFPEVDDLILKAVEREI